MDSLGIDIPLDKGFPVIVGSLAIENSTALLVYSGSKYNIPATKSCMLDSAVSRLSYTTSIAQWLRYFNGIKLEKR